MTVVSRRVLKWSAVFCALVLGLLAPAYGRLGETLEECQARYGMETGQNRGCTIFEKSGLLISVTFFYGVADSITFFKDRKDALGRTEPLSDNQIELLLEANDNGSGWFPWHAGSAEDRRWVSGQGNLLAVYLTGERCLGIMTLGHAERFRRAAETREAQQLDGF